VHNGAALPSYLINIWQHTLIYLRTFSFSATLACTLLTMQSISSQGEVSTASGMEVFKIVHSALEHQNSHAELM